MSKTRTPDDLTACRTSFITQSAWHYQFHHNWATKFEWHLDFEWATGTLWFFLFQSCASYHCPVLLLNLIQLFTSDGEETGRLFCGTVWGQPFDFECEQGKGIVVFGGIMGNHTHFFMSGLQHVSKTCGTVKLLSLWNITIPSHDTHTKTFWYCRYQPLYNCYFVPTRVYRALI